MSKPKVPLETVFNSINAIAKIELMIEQNDLTKSKHDVVYNELTDNEAKIFAGYFNHKNLLREDLYKQSKGRLKSLYEED